MELKIGSYTVKTFDEMNIVVVKTRAKKPSLKEPKPTGTVDAQLGYYGSVEGALLKVANDHLANEAEIKSAKDLVKEIGSMKELIKKTCEGVKNER